MKCFSPPYGPGRLHRCFPQVRSSYVQVQTEHVPKNGDLISTCCSGRDSGAETIGACSLAPVQVTELSSHIPSGDGNCEDRGAVRAPMCGASKTAGREKRSRGLGDDGGGWKSSKRVEVARALVLDRKRSSFFFLHRQLKRNLFSVLALLCPVYLPFAPLCGLLSYCQIG